MAASKALPGYALAIYGSDQRQFAPVVYDLTGAPIDIGSAEDNHIVLSEPSVAPHHLAIRKVRSHMCAVIDLKAARRDAEGFWLKRRNGDDFVCREHGQVPGRAVVDRCPLCGEIDRPLLLIRPLQPGDIFPIGHGFEAAVLNQATTNHKSMQTHSIADSPWPNSDWLENPPQQPSILFDDENRTLEERPYPFDDSNLWGWDPPQTPFPVFIHQRVNQYVARHARDNDDREVGGLLLGRPFIDPEEHRIYPIIIHAIAARFATESRGHLTFTHRTWLDLIQQREEHFPREEVMGWYHTHPGLSIFLSEWDLLIHRHFFREPWQIALVVDPHQDQAGIFVWSGGDILDPLNPYQPFRVAEPVNALLLEQRPRVRIKLGDPVP